jgi:hypothetical protein
MPLRRLFIIITLALLAIISLPLFGDENNRLTRARSASAQSTCSVGQYRAEYFNSVDLSGSPAFARCETTINYTWNDIGPGGGLGVDKFSVCWTGCHRSRPGRTPSRSGPTTARA